MSYCVLSTCNAMMHLMITVMNLMCVTERAVRMMVMISVAVMPIPVMCPAVVYVPPARVITPIPRTMPSVPCIAPEPIVDQRSVNVNRFDDIVSTIYVLIADYLNGNLVFLVFLNEYRGNVLEDILRKHSL